MALREVEDQVKAETISLIETRLCEVLGGRRKHDTYSGELFPQGLLYIVGVSTAADTWTRNADGLLEDLDRDES